jgi:peptidoglycan/LPS O-acetylase OafA/YrhL
METSVHLDSIPRRNIESNLRHSDNNFDFLRILAAFFVILWHSATLTGHNGFDPLFVSSSGSLNFGNIGVAIFFITSGFLISGSWERSPNIIKFFFNRLLRIYPGLICSVFFCTFIVGPLVTALPFHAYVMDRHTWSFLQNLSGISIQFTLPGCFNDNLCTNGVNGSLWTIPHEILCYFFLGILGVIGLLRFKSAYFCIFLILFSIHHAIANGQGWMFPSHIFRSLPFADFVSLSLLFCSGCLLKTLSPYLSLRADIFSISVIFLGISILVGNGVEALPIFLPYIIYFLAFSPAIPLRRFGKFGDFSYGTYLYAFPIQQYFARTDLSIYRYTLLHLFLSTLFALLAGAISWHLVEKHFLKFKSVSFFQHIVIFDRLLSFRIPAPRSSNLLLYWLVIGVATILPIRIAYKFIRHGLPASRVDFSKHQTVKVEGGWLVQGSDEAYRWIDLSGSLVLHEHAGASHFVIVGYVPSHFSEVTHVSASLDGTVVVDIEKPANADKGWSININVPVITDVDKQINVKITFNRDFIPSSGELDQRKMSAAISLVSIE